MFLTVWKLKHATSPNDPTRLPLYRAPGAWAQSSMSLSLCFLASAIISFMSPGSPEKWTNTIALVFFVIARSIASGVMLRVRSSMSAKTILAPFARKGSDVEMNVIAGTITSSPGLISQSSAASSSADVQLHTAKACLTPACLANSFSNACTSGPVSTPTESVSACKTRRIAAISSTSYRFDTHGYGTFNRFAIALTSATQIVGLTSRRQLDSKLPQRPQLLS